MKPIKCPKCDEKAECKTSKDGKRFWVCSSGCKSKDKRTGKMVSLVVDWGDYKKKNSRDSDEEDDEPQKKKKEQTPPPKKRQRHDDSDDEQEKADFVALKKAIEENTRRIKELTKLVNSLKPTPSSSPTDDEGEEEDRLGPSSNNNNK